MLRPGAGCGVLAGAGQAGGGVAVAARADPGSQRRHVGVGHRGAAADRARAGRDRRQLDGEPVGGRLRVGVGARDQAVRAPDRVQALAGEVHAEPARGADAGLRGVQDVQREPAGGRAGARLGGVRAAVEHEQQLVGAGLDALLGGQRAHAGADERLLVAGGDDDARLQAGCRGGKDRHGSGRPCSISSRPRS